MLHIDQTAKMLQLDLYTLTFVSASNFLLACAGLFAVHRLNRDCQGLRRCAVACLFLAAACATLAASLSSTDKRIVLLPSFAFFTGAIVFLDGIRAFRELKRPSWTYAAVSCVYALLIVWFIFFNDNPNARTGIRALSLSVIAMFAAFAMASRVPTRDRAVYWSTSAVFVLVSTMAFVRSMIAFFGPSMAGYQPKPLDYISLAVLNLFAMGCAFGLSMAANLRLRRHAEMLARYDPLTHLPNRRLFEEQLEEAERRAFTSKDRLALIYCDLDDFKNINDTLGHEGGDVALRTVAGRLRGVVGEDTCLARVGGDEFVVLLESAPPREDLLRLIEQLQDSVESNFESGGRSAPLRISCGIAVFPDDVGSASDMIRLADAGMYMMKQHGRYINPAA